MSMDFTKRRPVNKKNCSCTGKLGCMMCGVNYNKLHEENECMFCKNGRCTSDYSSLKCNGLDIPKDCPYSQSTGGGKQ